MNAPLASCFFDAADRAGERFREAGDLTLDRLHEDARVEDRWLCLHPREFLLLWHLAGHPREGVDESRLAADLWRSGRGGKADDIATLLARLRSRLAEVGLGELIVSDSEGGHRLDLRPLHPLAPGEGLRGH